MESVHPKPWYAIGTFKWLVTGSSPHQISWCWVFSSCSKSICPVSETSGATGAGTSAGAVTVTAGTVPGRLLWRLKCSSKMCPKCDDISFCWIVTCLCTEGGGGIWSGAAQEVHGMAAALSVYRKTHVFSHIYINLCI